MKKLISVFLALTIASAMALPSFAYLSTETLGLRTDNITFTGREFKVRGITDEVTRSTDNATYESSDTAIATVDESGRVKTLKAGNCTITVRNTETNETENVDIEVRNGGLTGISYDTIKLGKTSNINRDGASNLKYSTTNKRVATVDENGNVTAVGIGTCSIIIEDTENNVTDECVIRVEFIWYRVINMILEFIGGLFK